MSRSPGLESAPVRLEEGATGRALRALLAQEAVLVREGQTYAVRTCLDRRRRPRLRLSEGDFQRLEAEGALTPLPGGGHVLSARGCETARLRAPSLSLALALPQAARALRTPREAKRNHNAVAWLAARKDASGRPWLTVEDVRAADQLALDYQLSSPTDDDDTNWALDSGGENGGDPARSIHARDAAERVRSALFAVGSAAPLIILIVLKKKGLSAAENRLKLPGSSARHRLATGLRRLAAHYAQTGRA